MLGAVGVQLKLSIRVIPLSEKMGWEEPARAFCVVSLPKGGISCSETLLYCALAARANGYLTYFLVVNLSSRVGESWFMLAPLPLESSACPGWSGSCQQCPSPPHQDQAEGDSSHIPTLTDKLVFRISD